MCVNFNSNTSDYILYNILRTILSTVKLTFEMGGVPNWRTEVSISTVHFFSGTKNFNNFKII